MRMMRKKPFLPQFSETKVNILSESYILQLFLKLTTIFLNYLIEKIIKNLRGL